MMEQIRAFIAIELPAEIKDILSKLLDGLRLADEKTVRWVRPEGIHLTLKFLGNVPINMVPPLTQALEGTAESAEPCTLELHGLDSFPNLKSPRVVWIGVTGDIQKTITLQKQLDQALLPLGFPSEARKFFPHLTLGRVRDKANPHERLRLGNLIKSVEIAGSPAFSVDRISLMKSTLSSSGAIYDCIASVPLDRN